MACYLLFFKYILLTMQLLYIYEYVSLEKENSKIVCVFLIDSNKKSHHVQNEPFSWLNFNFKSKRDY